MVIICTSSYQAKIRGGRDNHELLHKGELFVAKFSDDGTGTWINLKKANMGMAETLVFARLAADKLGATTMDRPEWVAANPHKTEVYVCLQITKIEVRKVRIKRGTQSTIELTISTGRSQDGYRRW